MGKRGGKRRNRASQWTEQNSAKEEHPAAAAKKPKLVDTSSSSSSSSSQKSTSDSVDQVEVSLIGSEDISTLPEPFSIDSAKESIEEASNGNASQETSSFSHTTKILQIWKHLGHKEEWKPSKIQQYLWALLLKSDWNIIGVAPTGSGKTFSYAIPTILSNSGILVLVPTRELVQQVVKVFSKVCKAYSSTTTTNTQTQIPIVSIHGGVNRFRQQEDLEEAATTGSCVVVATPGRFLDLIKDTRLLPIFSWIVLDEADQLAKDGDLGPQVDQILEATKINSTRLVLVSATNPERTQETFQKWVGNQHVLVQVDRIQHSVETEPSSDAAHNNININKNAGTFSKIPSHLEQVLHVCAEHKKPRKLLHTLQQIYKNHPNQRSRPLGIVFFSKIEKLKHISILLEKEGVTGCVELHSQLASTKLRETNLAQFACGQKPLLLATDVAARGIDIPHVQFVIQYDFPGNLQQYVHRCGRAGRSKDIPKPTIYSFFTRNLKPMANDLIRLLEANNAWVDPNLRSLVDGNDKDKDNNNNNDRPDKTSNSKKGTKNITEEYIDEVDDFPELSANRIVLKRASHVSDASSSDEESDNDEE